MRDEHFTDEEVFSRTAVARLWWPGYLDLGAADYAAKVAEDGWHMYDLNDEGSFIQVGSEYVVAWDHDPISRATAHYPLAARIDGCPSPEKAS